MKKFLLFMVAAMLATVARAADDDTFAYQGLLFRVISEEDHTVEVVLRLKPVDNLSIPSFAMNDTLRYSVTGIGYMAFFNCADLTSVSIPNTVTIIRDFAFQWCTGMTSVFIPSSVSEIGNRAFECCTSLTSITIPDSVTEIGESAFSGCSSLTSVTIPNSVTEIKKSAFQYCGLTSVTIPNSVTKIGEYAFSGCTDLTSITIPNSVTEIGEAAFEDCRSLTSLTIPNSVTEIKQSTFNGCSGLTSFSIPNSITKIGGSAFQECTGLTSVTIPNSVTKIGEAAFMSCRGLTSVIIPNSVTEIGLTVFADCTDLTEIIVQDGNPNYASENGVLFNLDKTKLIEYPNGKEIEYTIPNSVVEIGQYAFYYCAELISVTIPASVTKIGQYAFRGCRHLKTIFNLNPIPQTIEGNPFLNVNVFEVMVYVPKGSSEEYRAADGWTDFTNFLEMGALEIALSEQTLKLTAGNSTTITATVTKDDDMTVESEEWSSSNPEIATVDNGVITAVASGETVIWFTVVDGYGVPHTEKCTVTVTGTTGVADVATDADASIDVFNLQGTALLRNVAATELRNLPAGIYIVRQGKSVKKIAVK